MDQKQQQYNEDNIKVLEGLEAVRLRPGMYIGSTSSKGLHHLVWEIVDNSIDEHMGGYGDEINVTIHKDNSVSVSDRGRGIPVGIHKEMGIPTLEVVLTVLHAGGKFGGDGSAYKSTGGLHGVGSSVTNALSEKMVATVKRDGKVFRLEFSKGETTKQLEVIGETSLEDTGTTIWFKPDPEIFKETLEFEFDIIRNRLRESAFLNAGLKIVLTDERTDENKVEEYHFSNGILDYVKFLNEKKKLLHQNVIHLKDEQNGVKAEVGFQYTADYKENITSFANNIKTYEGGTHESAFKTAITQTIKRLFEEKNMNKLLDKDEPLDGSDTRIGLVGVVSVKVPDPEFEGQTKTKLGNPEVRSIVQKIVQEQFSKFLSENPTELDLILQKVVQSYKERVALKRSRAAIRKQSKREDSSFTLPEKLEDCASDVPLEDRELFIVEGDSAGGTAKGAAAEFQGVLPLRGKILNVEKANLQKIYSSAEIYNLASAIGTGMGDEFDFEKRRYSKVIIMTDADVDGSHIRILLLTFFFRYMRPLVEKGCIYVAQPPLYGLKNKNRVMKFALDDAELEEAKKEYPNAFVQRYKGLGEMNKEELEETTMNVDNRTLLRISVDDAEYVSENIEAFMGDDSAPRKRYIEENSHRAEIDF